MTSTPTTHPATKAIAIKDDHLVTVNLPSPPLTPEERRTEFRLFLIELVELGDGGDLIDSVLSARRAFVKIIGDIDEAEFWDYFVAAVLQNRERTNALGVELEKVRGHLRPDALDDYATHADLSKLRAAVPEQALKEFGRALERVAGDNPAWQFLNPFPGNVSDVIFATLIGEREFDSDNPNEIDVIDNPYFSVNDIPADSKVFYENGDHPLNFAFSGRKSQLRGTALKVSLHLSMIPLSTLIHFDYALLRELDNDETIDLLKLGYYSAGLIGFNRTQGLFLRSGESSGTTTTREANGFLLPIHSPFSFYRIGRSATDAADRLYFYMSSEVEGASLIIVIIRYRGDGNDGWTTADFRINGLDADQTLENDERIVLPGNLELSLNVRYIVNHNGHRAIHVEPTTALSPDITYDISVSYLGQRSVRVPWGYKEVPLLGANATVGTFDPYLDCELQRRTGNTVMVELNEGVNGYVQVRVMVNGIAANNGAFIDTQRSRINSGLSHMAGGHGVTIGNDAVGISRVYITQQEKPLTVAQMRQIYGNIETPGTIYYARQAPEYKLDAKLQVRDSAGEFFTVGAGGNLVLDENGNPKNFLTNPITITDSNGRLNQRTIPEMATAKAIVVVVGEVDTDENGDTVLTDDSSRTIYDPRPFHQSHSIMGRLGRRTEIHYYFSFPQRDTIRLDYRTHSGGQSNGIHQIFLLR